MGCMESCGPRFQDPLTPALPSAADLQTAPAPEPTPALLSCRVPDPHAVARSPRGRMWGWGLAVAGGLSRGALATHSSKFPFTTTDWSPRLWPSFHMRLLHPVLLCSFWPLSGPCSVSPVLGDPLSCLLRNSWLPAPLPTTQGTLFQYTLPSWELMLVFFCLLACLPKCISTLTTCCRCS